jgi:hypothetical protein
VLAIFFLRVLLMETPAWKSVGRAILQPFL